MATLPGLPQTEEPEPDALPVEPDDGTTIPGALPSRATFQWTLRGHSATVEGHPPRPVHNSRRAARRRRSLPMVRVWAFVIAILAALGFAAWASDFVTMQGERTVYTVDCTNGSWQGDRCSGKVAAGTRYRFRALKPHGEVIFWTVGSREPSGRFNECQIQDGRNWVCKVCADASRTITCRWCTASPSQTPRSRPVRTALSRSGAGCFSSAATPPAGRCRPRSRRRASARWRAARVRCGGGGRGGRRRRGRFRTASRFPARGSSRPGSPGARRSRERRCARRRCTAPRFMRKPLTR